MERISPEEHQLQQRRNYAREQYKKIKADPEKYQKLQAYYKLRYQKRHDMNLLKTQKYQEKSQVGVSKLHSSKPVNPDKMDVTPIESTPSEFGIKSEPVNKSELTLGVTSGKPLGSTLRVVESLEATLDEADTTKLTFKPETLLTELIKPQIRIIPLLKELLDFLQSYKTPHRSRV